MDLCASGPRPGRYEPHNLLDRRLTILRPFANTVAQLNVYVKRRNRKVAEGISEITSNLEVLLALAPKHRDLSSLDPETLTDTFLSRLRLVCPGLSNREKEICVLIARGLTSEAIAIELGISVNTVLTYRKRAYSRLNITSHNELMRLMISRVDQQ